MSFFSSLTIAAKGIVPTRKANKHKGPRFLGCSTLRSHHYLRARPAFDRFPSIQNFVFLRGQTIIEHLPCNLCKTRHLEARECLIDCNCCFILSVSKQCWPCVHHRSELISVLQWPRKVSDVTCILHMEKWRQNGWRLSQCHRVQLRTGEQLVSQLVWGRQKDLGIIWVNPPGEGLCHGWISRVYLWSYVGAGIPIVSRMERELVRMMNLWREAMGIRGKRA